MKPPDDVLAARAAAGDDAAFTILVDRHRAALLRTATARLGSLRSDAEDVVQDALARAHADMRRRGAPSGNVRAWLHAIVRNRAVDVVRLHARPQVPLEEQDGASEPLDDLLVRREQVDTMISAIDGLPARQRDAFVDVIFSGASYRQVAASQRTSPSAVKALVNRARRTVREAAAALLPLPALLRDRLWLFTAHADPGMTAGLAKGCAVVGSVATLSLTVGQQVSVPLQPAVAKTDRQAPHLDDRQMSEIAARETRRKRSAASGDNGGSSPSAASASDVIAVCADGYALPDVPPEVLRAALHALPIAVAEYTSCEAQLRGG